MTGQVRYHPKSPRPTMPKRITTTDEQHTHIAREFNHPPHHRFQPGFRAWRISFTPIFSNNNDKTTIEMNAYLLEGKDDGGNVVCRVITHECGCYKRLASNIVSKRNGVASIDSRILSIEEAKQISPMGGGIPIQDDGFSRPILWFVSVCCRDIW